MSDFLGGLKKTAFIVLVVLTCECIVGSSGRWLVIGPLSIRMWLFIAAFLLSLPFVVIRFQSVIKNASVINLLVLAIVVAVAFVNGYTRGNNRQFILADLTSFAFLAIVPAYLAVIDTEEKAGKLMAIASYSSLALAGLTIAMHFVFMVMQYQSIQAVNLTINSVQLGGLFNFDDKIYRIFFRSSICFILPFIYFFSRYIETRVKRAGRLDAVFMSMSFIAIVLTYTRSIWLGSLVAVIVFIAMNIRDFKAVLKGIAVTLGGFAIFVMLSWAGYGYEGVFSNVIERISLDPIGSAAASVEDEQLFIQLESENIRALRFSESCEVIEENFVLGKGLGVEINDGRPGVGKIEYTYLDLMSKMGFVGILVFLSALFNPYVMAVKRKKTKRSTASMRVMMCVTACLIVASFFNPFITSPIGFSLYAVLVAAVYAKSKPGTDADEAGSA